MIVALHDGHAKNFSIFLEPGGRFSLTPFYDVLSAQPAADRGQMAPPKFRLAMSAGTNRHYRLSEVMGRHFAQTGKAAGLGADLMRGATLELLDQASNAVSQTRDAMPPDFAEEVHASIAAAIDRRLPHLARAVEEF